MMNQIIKLPTPSSISFFWNFGSILGLSLAVQIITGLILSMHYNPSLLEAFSSVVHISNDVNSGWLIRFLHANGATLFFVSIYFHVSRGLFYKSYKKTMMTWFSGVSMLFLFMGVAFLGYVLPWGQMSYWGATVITNLVSAIPYLGGFLVEWIWGGFSVGGPTLSRFYSLHFLLPLSSVVLVVLHLALLHETGSSNPLGVSKDSDKMSFHPFFTVKDVLGFWAFLVALFYISCYKPLMFMDSDNFVEANPMVTPVHIQPEWYFLFAYAILRSIPNKLGGVIGLVFSISLLFLLPILGKESFFKSVKHQLASVACFSSFIMLTFLGAMPVESPFSSMSPLFSVAYFLMFGIFVF